MPVLVLFITLRQVNYANILDMHFTKTQSRLILRGSAFPAQSAFRDSERRIFIRHWGFSNSVKKVLMMKSVLNSYLNMHRTSPKRCLYPVFKWMEWRMAGIPLIIHRPMQKRIGIVSPLEHLFAFSKEIITPVFDLFIPSFSIMTARLVSSNATLKSR